MKKSAKRNAPVRSERAAWEIVRDSAQAIQVAAREAGDRHQMQRVIGLLVDRLKFLSAQMREQLTVGVHANPPLTVFSLANPPRRGAKLMSRRLYTIEYRHAGNQKDYYHDFKSGTEMLAMPDGSVVIRRPGAKVWADLPE